MINWQYYPKFSNLPEFVDQVLQAFVFNEEKIDSSKNSLTRQNIFSIIENELKELGFEIKIDSRNSEGEIELPVYYGLNGKPELSFFAESYQKDYKCVIDISGNDNKSINRCYRVLLQSSIIPAVEYLIMALPNKPSNPSQFLKIKEFLDVLYSSKQNINLNGLLIIGY
ncbi:hypothetical protein Thena_0376 [Thermodesulfobium narugense DSM 14796]|uniref:Uncharacterized protein n=1 Tax=Thermodesulfobium narugense DSM 14796 TaxID=747365 RepID=M1E4D0_9BACT|nr:hypothetical protein [Thermodesulfobium narugense]AEE14022.1 hypothetical protein Thena_0376 [Thermodesulfobium narugense DSM 14796]